LSNLGLTETIARDLDDYVNLTVALAQDLPRLAAIRANLRPRMAASPLCDGSRFAREFHHSHAPGVARLDRFGQTQFISAD